MNAVCFGVGFFVFCCFCCCFCGCLIFIVRAYMHLTFENAALGCIELTYVPVYDSRF